MCIIIQLYTIVSLNLLSICKLKEIERFSVPYKKSTECNFFRYFLRLTLENLTYFVSMMNAPNEVKTEISLIVYLPSV